MVFRTDVSGQPIGPIIRNLCRRWVKSQNSADITSVTAETWNHLKVHCHFHDSPPLRPIMFQTNIVYEFTHFPLKSVLHQLPIYARRHKSSLSPSFSVKRMWYTFLISPTHALGVAQLISPYQYSETNVMHFLFNLLRIKGLYMFRALLTHPQEALYKRQLVWCLRVMSVGCTRIGVELVSPTPFPLQSWCSQLT
jgi:hypothetical protein